MIYDNSQISTYSICPMKYYLKYVEGLEKADADLVSVDINFGSFTHEYLEEFYKSIENHRYPEPNISDIWLTYPLVPGEELKTQEGGKFLCEQYKKHYLKQDEKLEVLAVEYCLDFNVGSHPFTVKVDTVVKVNGEIYGLEHKTTGKIWVNYFDRYFINSQISAQTYAIKEKFGECSGIIVNALGLDFLKKPNLLDPDDPAVKEYSNVETKYSKYYKGEKTYCQGYRANFQRSIANRTPLEIKDWYENARDWIDQIELSKKRHKFLKTDNGGACSMFRGCTMKELCKVSKGMEIDEQIMEVLYRRKDDPLDYLGRS